MPLYELRCDGCGFRTEFRAPIDKRGHYSPLCPECLEFTRYRAVSPFVQLQPPTGAALRSHFRRAQEAGAELDHAGVSTAGLFAQAVQVASEQPSIPPPD